MIAAVLGLLEAATWAAPIGAALWGLASVLLSPCHLTSLPLLVGFLERLPGQARSARALAGWVTVGVSLSLVAVAVVSLAAGRLLGDLWGVGPWVTIGFLLLAGLALLDAFPLPELGRLRPERARAGAGGALGAGGMLGVTLGPCTFAFFAPLIAFATGSAGGGLKAATVGAFVAAHLAATWITGLAGARLAQRLSGGRYAGPVKAAVGVVAIGLALGLIVTTP